MNRLVKKRLLPFVLFGLALTGCKGGDSTSADDKTAVQDFVAVTSTDWDAEVTLGDFKYEFGFTLNNDSGKTLAFIAKCVGEKPSQGGGGLPFSVGTNETSSANESAAVDYSSHNFSFDGSWELDKGYGYILSVNDSKMSVIHSDYDKIQGRHSFYYEVVNGENSAISLFQAKDSNFRNDLASNYEIWDIRDSKYVFTALATGNNNSVAYSYLYLHKDGKAVINAPKDSSRTVTMGLNWSQADEIITLTDGTKSSTSEQSINNSHPGYRIVFSSYAFYYSASSTVLWSDLTSEDFDGNTLYAFTGSYSDGSPFGGTNPANLNLTDAGKAILYANGNLNKAGKYTFVNDVFTITMNGEEAVTVNKEEGSYKYVTTITVSGFMGSSDVSVTLVYTPTV